MPDVEATDTDESRPASESKRAKGPDAVPGADGTSPRERRPSGASYGPRLRRDWGADAGANRSLHPT